ncbi:MAG TPA: hypothetical protein VFH31_03040 [Pyrinomonadaceae bacterium]|nr:hypothetical protein [Pyrinomonadaceae bacterium]
MIYSPIIFGLGPSGVVESHILELLAPEIGFFLLDLDTPRPFVDGLEQELRESLNQSVLRNPWATD